MRRVHTLIIVTNCLVAVFGEARPAKAKLWIIVGPLYNHFKYWLHRILTSHGVILAFERVVHNVVPLSGRFPATLPLVSIFDIFGLNMVAIILTSWTFAHYPLTVFQFLLHPFAPVFGIELFNVSWPWGRGPDRRVTQVAGHAFTFIYSRVK